MSVTVAADKRFDDNLFEILKERRTLTNFLDTVFGFLKRRTDFYQVAETNASPVGLPKGLAETILRNCYYKWEKYEEPLVVADEASTTKQSTKKKTAKGDNKGGEFSTADSYNGAVQENYSWAQTISDLDVTIKIPEGVKAKQLDVKIEAQSISVRMLQDGGETILAGDFPRKVKPTDAIWSVVGGKLEIHLDKVADVWWDKLLEAESKLDLTKIDCSRPFEELSDEAQAKIEELTWNQERRRQGLPTSEDVVFEDNLKKAWNAEGSPFSGPFDPKSVVRH
ncbi:PREDICTED: nudC domain-containing protein 3 [Nicrophorus vespilloides]|uniref:Nuclear migration protein nudC n=1 Tax=Nicrophorus vespilloides TaxID=110193 RepID=A0ABM1NFJ5_NICVS|nr:PREDICTED: nudC domain-containing protein 3 [Nicrophorus vespilloides]